MATLSLDRFGRRHTGRILASTSTEKERGVFFVSYQAGDRGPDDTRIGLEFRVNDGTNAHKLYTLELSGEELVELVRKVATSRMQVDHRSAFNLADRLRSIFR